MLGGWGVHIVTEATHGNLKCCVPASSTGLFPVRSSDFLSMVCSCFCKMPAAAGVLSSESHSPQGPLKIHLPSWAPRCITNTEGSLLPSLGLDRLPVWHLALHLGLEPTGKAFWDSRKDKKKMRVCERLFLLWKMTMGLCGRILPSCFFSRQFLNLLKSFTLLHSSEGGFLATQ